MGGSDTRIGKAQFLPYRNFITSPSFTLEIEGSNKKFSIHEALLKSTSDALWNACDHNWLESRERCYKFSSDVVEDVITCFVEWAYTGDYSIPGTRSEIHHDIAPPVPQPPTVYVLHCKCCNATYCSQENSSHGDCFSCGQPRSDYSSLLCSGRFDEDELWVPVLQKPAQKAVEDVPTEQPLQKQLEPVIEEPQSEEGSAVSVSSSATETPPRQASPAPSEPEEIPPLLLYIHIYSFAHTYFMDPLCNLSREKIFQTLQETGTSWSLSDQNTIFELLHYTFNNLPESDIFLRWLGIYASSNISRLTRDPPRLGELLESPAGPTFAKHVFMNVNQGSDDPYAINDKEIARRATIF
ncbi:MAG: hypothetical protein M1834_005979 [Cirrosporium novae-zelandiae]|nr:MAG: hypothetical protein M1834_005979 [Cirrosporium novae-zelandiae]